MRAVLSRIPVCRLGRQIAGAGDRIGDDRSGRRGLSAGWLAMDDAATARDLVLVGCGKMGTAMLRGWIGAGVASRFLVIEPAGTPAGLDSSAEILWYPGPEALPNELAADAVVFAVKPQVVDTVLPSYCRWAHPGTLFLSIVAGKTLGGLARHLGAAAIVRTMPNTPAAIGRGITVACASPLVTFAQRRLCERLLAAIGESAWVDDEGLPSELAARLALSTVAGSGELARISAESPAQLRENVTSPGGTTRAALDVLMAADGLEALIERAVAAAAARSRELAN